MQPGNDGFGATPAEMCKNLADCVKTPKPLIGSQSLILSEAECAKIFLV